MVGLRLFKVPLNAQVVKVAARLSGTQISVMVVCDAVGAATG
jgi:hypothetical protein